VQVSGTPLYMPPEQLFAGAGARLGPGADVWALGILAWEALSQVPRGGASRTPHRKVNEWIKLVSEITGGASLTPHTHH
jgi:serine/threonine protein kinase